MTQPVISELAQEIYDDLAPLAYADEENGWVLAYWIDALCSIAEQIATYARDQEDGTPGWAIVMDVDNAPEEVLPWLAQFVGARLSDSLTEGEKRTFIKEVGGWKRGTVAEIAAAVAPFLTGTKTVTITERFDPANPTVDSAYHFQIRTLASETPDSAVTEAAVLARKPAGLIMHYSTYTGYEYGDMTEWTDYDDLEADVAVTDYDDLSDG